MSINLHKNLDTSVEISRIRSSEISTETEAECMTRLNYVKSERP